MKISEIIKKGKVDIEAIEDLIAKNENLIEENSKLKESFAYRIIFHNTYFGCIPEMITFKTKAELEKHVYEIIERNDLRNNWIDKIIKLLKKRLLFRILFRGVYLIIKNGYQK